MTDTTNSDRHGGPEDRGGADAWYHRPRAPHYFCGATDQSEKIPAANMTAEELKNYHRGYDDTLAIGTKTEWWYGE